MKRGDRIVAASEYATGRIGTFEKAARNGYSWISLPDGEETGIWLWPTAQILPIGTEKGAQKWD